ncbi:hypothetical protein ACTXGK_10645 [Psychrobacter sp. T6-5]|uniref:hypothetical protein n=1 Tax=Psychrobacter sp. T6-5 TaxID=3457451 RepID=UPI003FD65145
MTWLRGKAKKYDGGAIDYVSIFNWPTGECIAQVQPDEMGNWKYDYYADLNIGITYVANGCEPITHGPYIEPVVIYEPFVDFIDAVNSMDRGSGSAPMTTVIPSTVQEGDMLVLGIMRRGDITVSDNNNGVWSEGPSSRGDRGSYIQSSTIYYRTAKADDAGKTIEVSTSYSGPLVVYLSIYRGKFAPLKVVKAISNPALYDETYKENVKNLAPIEHDGGFMVRAVNNLYAKTDASMARMDVIGMTSTGPESGEPKRLQVAYKHLETGGVLSGIAYDTDNGNPNDIIPDVAIILDEIGR